MGLFGKLFNRFRDDWCKDCKCVMEETRRQLFALSGVTVGHFKEHTDADFYKKRLIRVEKKADIHQGVYACGAIQYRCPGCGRRLTALKPFLPVRDEEKYEVPVLFEHGELDEFLWG